MISSLILVLRSAIIFKESNYSSALCFSRPIMKAAVVKKDGDKTSVVLDESYPDPKPGPNEVLVKIQVSPMQPSDHVNAIGGFPNTQFPRVLGRDFAGVVVAPDSSPLKGKLVYGTSGNEGAFTRDGAHAELMAVPVDAVVEAPKGLTALQVGALGTPWSTACLALTSAHLREGETVAITGAGGSVGSAAVQLAKGLFNAKVLTIGRDDKYDVATSSDPKLSKVQDLTGGKGVNVFFDTTGDMGLINAGYAQLAQGGRLTLITTGAAHGSSVMNVELKDLYRLERSLVGCNSVEHSAAFMADLFRKMSPLFESGKMTPPDLSRWEKIKIDDVAKAYEEMAQGSRKKFAIVEE